MHACTAFPSAPEPEGSTSGLQSPVPGYRTVCYVEREAYAAAILVARMEDKALDQAPLWDDIASFDGRQWRGAVDILTGGYPCQPFSIAGKRRGADDPRHLWPHFARIIGECQPEWVFLENVANHLNLGYRQVRGELEGLGYGVTEGLFTAAEVGAPHKRQRLFVLAHAECGGRGQPTGDPYRQGKPLCSPERQEGASGSGSGSEDVVAPPAVVAPLAVADTACELHDGTRKRRPGGRDEPADECRNVANADGQRRMQTELGQPQVSRSDPCYARQEWQKLRERNEALDCRVYARAAAWILGADRWDEATWRRLEEQAGVETRLQVMPTGAADQSPDADTASVTKAGTPSTPRRRRRAYTPKFMRD